MAKTPPLTVNLEEAVRESLEHLAAQSGRDITELVTELVTDAVEQYVALQDWQVKAIEEAIAEADAGAPRIPHEAVMAWLDSWDTPDELPPPA